MQNRIPIPFDTYVTDLDYIILSYLSFYELNQYIESPSSENPTVKMNALVVMKRKYPHYTNLKKEKEDNNYPALIDNFRSYKFSSDELPAYLEKAINKNEKTYRSLCLYNASNLRNIIEQKLYLAKQEEPVNEGMMRDLIFHYCTCCPQEAGQLLNKHIDRSWKEDVSTLMIDYAANVNVKIMPKGFPTLFHAIRSGGSVSLIQNLLQHGANYSGYATYKQDINYTLMLIAALQRDINVVAVLANSFPKELYKTKVTLDKMLAYPEKYSCEYGDFTISNPQSGIKYFYTYTEILDAKMKILQLMATISSDDNSFTEYDKKDILSDLRGQVSKTTLPSQCYKIYEDNIEKDYFGLNNGNRYSADKKDFIEMIQHKLVSHLTVYKFNRIFQQLSLYSQLCQEAIQHPVFAEAHEIQGVRNKYRAILKSRIHTLEQRSSPKYAHQGCNRAK